MLRIFITAALAVAVIAVSSGNLNAGGDHDDSLKGQIKPTPQAEKLKLGAQLYDNWPKLTGNKPEGNHPLYPKESKKKGTSTWRCKECHGWDYIGKDGRYSKGSHYTGIEGVYEARGKGMDELEGALSGKGGGHDFSPYLSEKERGALALFVNKGLMDFGAAQGSAEKGKPLYKKTCSICHGADGNNMDFKGKKDGIQGVGWIGNDNPQETLHKIRWGHPGSPMPSVIVNWGLTDADAADILAYSLSLGK